MKSLELHTDFRLWLTSEAHPKFPTILLQSSFKITYEVSEHVSLRVMQSYHNQFSPHLELKRIYRERTSPGLQIILDKAVPSGHKHCSH